MSSLFAQLKAVNESVCSSPILFSGSLFSGIKCYLSSGCDGQDKGRDSGAAEVQETSLQKQTIFYQEQRKKSYILFQHNQTFHINIRRFEVRLHAQHLYLLHIISGVQM